MYESIDFSRYIGVLYTNISIFVHCNFYNKNVLSENYWVLLNSWSCYTKIDPELWDPQSIFFIETLNFL